MSGGGATAVLRPAGLRICWASKPDAPNRCCTLPPGHDGDHEQEYSGTYWPKTTGDAR